jgi:phosphoglycolate phosphatase-like HAD superfamily hydrolase
MQDKLPGLKVLILDFDGVVIESNDVKTEAFRKVFEGFPEFTGKMMDYHHENVSQSRFVKFDHLLSLMGESGNETLKATIAERFSKQVFEAMMSVPLVPGAETFLAYATTKLPVYLASITPAEELSMILHGRKLSHWFKGVYGCPPWPKHLAINDILEKEKLLPENAVLIGDSAGDQRAAALSGVHFLARNSGLDFIEPVPVQFKDMNEIAVYFKKILS